MGKNSKEAYKAANENFLAKVSRQEGVEKICDGVYCRVLSSGTGKSPVLGSVVSVFYKGSLMSGEVFDTNMGGNVADAFRLRDLIPGWQKALCRMREGDRWEVYISPTYGYGSRGVSGIPGNSALVFEIELVRVD